MSKKKNEDTSCSEELDVFLEDVTFSVSFGLKRPFLRSKKSFFTFFIIKFLFFLFIFFVIKKSGPGYKTSLFGDPDSTPQRKQR
jgi:hypothetical protein